MVGQLERRSSFLRLTGGRVSAAACSLALTRASYCSVALRVSSTRALYLFVSSSLNLLWSACSCLRRLQSRLVLEDLAFVVRSDRRTKLQEIMLIPLIFVF